MVVGFGGVKNLHIGVTKVSDNQRGLGWRIFCFRWAFLFFPKELAAGRCGDLEADLVVVMGLCGLDGAGGGAACEQCRANQQQS